MQIANPIYDTVFKFLMCLVFLVTSSVGVASDVSITEKAIVTSSDMTDDVINVDNVISYEFTAFEDVGFINYDYTINRRIDTFNNKGLYINDNYNNTFVYEHYRAFDNNTLINYRSIKVLQIWIRYT